MMKLYIISGMSGSGKSQALKIFEDFGFFCVDNIPIQVVLDFVGICLKNTYSKYENIAISIDSRAGESLACFEDLLIALREKNVKCKIIFFNASDSVLVRRYSETRHRHPLGESLLEGIMLERKVIDGILKFADEMVDTTDINVFELKGLISVLIGQCREQYLNIFILSFGYKYGIPNDADIVYDVRFLANPNYVHELKFKTGRDETVKDYIEKQKEFKIFFDIFSKLIDTTLPSYVKEGKSHLTIAVGCTGGKHRSVFTAIKLEEFFKNKKYKVRLKHRDILIS
ncbi:MAG: RNase adapter RapZ [Endomicrobiia bacterium]|nr:MAG: RNase adapter RapZ [Endomicrobiia bacterium]